MSVDKDDTLVTRRRSKHVAEKNPEMPSDSQTDLQSVVFENLQNQRVKNSQEVVVLEQAKSIARELGTSVAHIMKNKVVEDAKKVLDFIKAIQNSAAKEVGEMLKSQMQVKREQGCSEAAASDAGASKGNVSHNTLSDTIDLDQPSPTQTTANIDDVPLSRVYSNLHKALPPHHLPNLSLSLIMIKSLIHSM